MISCKKCNFEINEKMRFSLTKNFCPSCGSNLFSEDDSLELNAISHKIRKQDFMISLSDEIGADKVQLLCHDLSIFIKFNWKEEGIISDSEQEQDGDKQDTPLRGSSEDGRKTNNISRKISRIGSSNSGNDRLSQIRRQSSLKTDSKLDSDEYDSDDSEEEEPDEETARFFSSETKNDSSAERVNRLKSIYKDSPTLKQSNGFRRVE